MALEEENVDVKRIERSQLDLSPSQRAGDGRADESPRKAPYLPPAVVRHGAVQRVTLGGGSFIP